MPKRADDLSLSVINLDEHNIGPVKFSFYIFAERTGTRSRAWPPLIKQDLKSSLDANGGVRVYRDDVRVYDLVSLEMIGLT